MSLWITLVSLLFTPLVVLLVDGYAGLRARRVPGPALSEHACSDFQVLVPIYGNVRYLQNVEYLQQYGGRVLLCTTTHESADFYRELEEIASRNGFQIIRAAARPVATRGKRATSGAVRDTIVREAMSFVSATYVVCVDADSTSAMSFDRLVGAMEERHLDLVSVPLVPANHSHNWLTRLQTYEYSLAMRLRKVMPWLISGACHAARADVYRRIMQRHSLFFQGNDVEVGIIAGRLRYRIGHIPFAVLTDVPETPAAWWRQRLAWSAGEVRLFLLNPQLVVMHPLLWLYGGVIVLVGFPLRWYWLSGASTGSLLYLGLVYVLLTAALHRGKLSGWLLLLPFYAAVLSLVMVPLGLLRYLGMAWRDRNLGLIRTRQLRSERDGQGREVSIAEVALQ